MSSRIRGRRAARAALLAGSLATVFGGTELLLRWLDLPRFDACSDTAEYAVPDPQLGFAGRPGGSVRGIPLNEEGLRGPVLAEPKPQDRFRILFLGDSTCWGVGVPIERTFAARTTQLLSAAQPDERFEFLIGAFPGYSTYHSRILLERMLPMQPDLVVLYVGARNDPWRARYFPDADIPQPPRPAAGGRGTRYVCCVWSRPPQTAATAACSGSSAPRARALGCLPKRSGRT